MSIPSRWNIPKCLEYTRKICPSLFSLRFSLFLLVFLTPFLSLSFSFSLYRVVCRGSRGSSADEFSCRDCSLGEAFGWCLIWTPHSSSPLPDLWPHRKVLPGEHTWFLLSITMALADTRRSPDDTVAEHNRWKENLFTCLVGQQSYYIHFFYFLFHHFPYTGKKMAHLTKNTVIFAPKYISNTWRLVVRTRLSSITL